MIKCMIIDDEPLAVKLLKEYVKKVPDLELVMSGEDVFKGLKLVQENAVDLVFLDIQMPQLTGMQFMKIMDGKAKVILTTAYEEYAVQAFEQDVIDYLVKPFSPERFIIAVNKARERINKHTSTNQTEVRDYIFVKSDYKILKISLKDIYYFEGLRDYVATHTVSGKILTLQNLSSFEEMLRDRDFFRIHKSYLISIGKIDSIEKKRVIIHGKYLPVGDTYLKAFRERLDR
jgi:two-component system, LytTR family, response regulator